MARWSSQWLDRCDVKEHTRRAYHREIDRFVIWCGKRRIREGRALKARHVEAFLFDMRSEAPAALQRIGAVRPLAPSSVDQTRRIVGLLLKQAVQERFIAPDILGSTAVIRDAVPPSRIDHDAALALALSLRGVLGELPLRNDVARWLSAQLAFWCGATPAEMTHLMWDQVEVDGTRVRVRWPGHQPELHFWRELPSFLAPPLSFGVHHERCDAVFASQDGTTAVSSRTIARWIKQVCEPFAPDGARITARALRTAFVALARSGGWHDDHIAMHLRRRQLRSRMPPLTDEESASKLVDTAAHWLTGEVAGARP